MQVPFRQGIVRSVPNFLQITGNTVSIVIPQPDYMILTLADGMTDYLLSEKFPVPNAWMGPFSSGTNYWLYWDIHPTTGAKSYGHTLYEPVESSVAPISPVGDQHWFDTASNTMKVWNAAAGRWVHKIRVFAARLAGTSLFVSLSVNSPAFEGTQVGSYINSPVLAGYLVFDGEGKALRNGNGTFFTTEDKGITGVTSASRVRLGTVLKEAESIANMARNTVVAFTDFDEVGPAEPYMFTRTIQYGIIEEDVIIGAYVNVVTDGTIISSEWDWSPYTVNTPLYIGNGGRLVTTPIPPAFEPVAIIIGVNSIQLGTPRYNIVYNNGGGPMTTSELGTGVLSVPAENIGNPIVVGDNDPRLTNARTPLAHAHAIGDITNLQTALDDKVAKAGDTMTGSLILNADPTVDLEAATKHYVDNSTPDLSTVVAKAGDTMTGSLILNADPTVDLGAATKQYVDNHTSPTMSAPVTEILFGTGTGVTSSPLLAYDDATGTFDLGFGLSDTPGSISISAQSVDTTGDGGSVYIRAGDSTPGTSGMVSIQGGSGNTDGASVKVYGSETDSGGQVSLQGGVGPSPAYADSAILSLNGGNLFRGGPVSISAGQGPVGGDITMAAGDTDSTGTELGGYVSISAGAKNSSYGSGVGGYVKLQSGPFGNDYSKTAVTYLMGGEAGVDVLGRTVTRATEQVLVSQTASLFEPPAVSDLGTIPCFRQVALNLDLFYSDPVDLVCPISMNLDTLWLVKAYVSLSNDTDRATYEIITTMEYSGATGQPIVRSSTTVPVYRSSGATTNDWNVVAGDNGVSIKYTISSAGNASFVGGGNVAATLLITQVVIPPTGGGG